MKNTIDKNWDHKGNEEKLYMGWEEAGYFRPESNRNVTSTELFHRKDTEKDSDPKNLKSYILTPDKFVIMMPPPNVTGKLHIGHAMVVTLEDILTRYHRLLGDETLWLPGTDHAGIATQSVVDRALKKKDIDRHKIGRQKFVEEVWKWKEEYGGVITNQIRRMGASCDWSRERFTLDEGLSQAVNEAFVKLYQKGLIYRGEYIVNWCPKCGTAIADDEVEHITQKAKLYYFKYDQNFPITIATTRPETKLGDVAVAVNPGDERYKKYIGQEFDIDLDGVKRKIKIIAERSIDMKFGSGAVGLTPAHSAVDWKIAEQNDLPKIKVIDEHGRIINVNKYNSSRPQTVSNDKDSEDYCSNSQQAVRTKDNSSRPQTVSNDNNYDGLKVIEARHKIIEHLKSSGLLEREQEIENNLSVCYRCGGAIEPLPSLQWFVKMNEMAKRAKKAVEDGEIEIIPKRFEKVYYNWMDNIRDWCISRQLWWGHRIPVWYKQDAISNSKFLISNQTPNPNDQKANKLIPNKLQADEDIYVGLTPPEGEGWVQDEDVLDTWFSSALWPFSTLGWPNVSEKRIVNSEKQSDYDRYYPTTVMETGYDILFFWVARMIMMGQELTGKVPFKTVYLHGLVRDEHNRKISKSLGNGIDPLDEIEKYGTDALRMALVVGATPGNDVAVGDSKIRGYRNFSNKIWNASRFVILNISGGNLQTGEIGEETIDIGKIDIVYDGEGGKQTTADTEILNRLINNPDSVIKNVTKHINKYEFSLAGEKLYDFFWHDFCDVYIEEAKKQLQNPEQKELTRCILFKVLRDSLKLLHPFAPFVTEAVWKELIEICPGLEKSIMVSKWPE